MVAPAVRNERLAEVIDDYSLRIYGAVLERTAKLRFDHPYAVVAVAGKPESPTRGDSDSAFTGVPVFSAWVDEPTEPEDEPSAGS